MPNIYRVENNDGEGCYNGIDSDLLASNASNGLSDHVSDKNHPTPYRDKGIKRDIKFNEICGFKTLKQANKWFTKRQYEWLESYGFYLKRIEVKQITAIGEYQVLAIR